MKCLVVLVAAGILTAATSAPVEHPRWAVRTSYDGANHFIDQPSCHPLAFFLNDTARLNYHHSIIHIEPGRTKDETKSQTIGKVAGWKIVQVTHNISDGALYLRLLLVERHSGEFCQIYHQEYMGSPDDPLDAYGVYQKVLPAYLVTVGSETILAVRDPLSGNGGWFDEHYWTFDKDGPIDLSVSEAIQNIRKSLLPKGSYILNGDGFNVERLAYTSPVWGPKDPHVSPTGGEISIQFALKDHHLVVVSQKFSPN
jgi:hypothetical protein